MTTKAEEYQRYLQSDHWRTLRHEALNVHGRDCACCKKKPVDVHHLRYGTWYDVGVDDLIPLCRSCHDKAHTIKKARTLIYANIPSGRKRERLLGILARASGQDGKRYEKGKRTLSAERLKSRQDRHALREQVEKVLGLKHKHSNNLSTAHMARVVESKGRWVPRHIRRLLQTKYRKHPEPAPKPVGFVATPPKPTIAAKPRVRFFPEPIPKFIHVPSGTWVPPRDPNYVGGRAEAKRLKQLAKDARRKAKLARKQAKREEKRRMALEACPVHAALDAEMDARVARED